MPERTPGNTTGPVSGAPSPAGRPRVLLIALSYKLSKRAKEYTDLLVARDVAVDLVVTDENSCVEVELDPAVRVHPIVPAEYRRPGHRLEQLLIKRIPGGLLARVRKLTGRGRVLRPVDRAVAAVERLHRRVAGAFHQRIFMPVYRTVRPWLLANAARPVVRGLQVGTADRIIAAEINAVTLGCRLARRHPDIPATTAMDRALYADRDTSTDQVAVVG